MEFSAICEALALERTHDTQKPTASPQIPNCVVSLWLSLAAVTSAWKQLLPLGVVNSGGQHSRSQLSLPHVVFFGAALQELKGSSQNTPQKELTLAFNKMPEVAEDAWLRLSDGFSNWFHSKEKKGLFEV